MATCLCFLNGEVSSHMHQIACSYSLWFTAKALHSGHPCSQLTSVLISGVDFVPLSNFKMFSSVLDISMMSVFQGFRLQGFFRLQSAYAISISILLLFSGLEETHIISKPVQYLKTVNLYGCPNSYWLCTIAECTFVTFSKGLKVLYDWVEDVFP